MYYRIITSFSLLKRNSFLCEYRNWPTEPQRSVQEHGWRPHLQLIIRKTNNDCALDFSFFSDLWSVLYVYSIIEVVFNNIISLTRPHLGQKLLRNITYKIRCRDTQFSRKIHSKVQYPLTCCKWQVNYNFSRFNLKISSLSNYFRSTIAWTDFRKHYTVTVRW